MTSRSSSVDPPSSSVEPVETTTSPVEPHSSSVEPVETTTSSVEPHSSSVEPVETTTSSVEPHSSSVEPVETTFSLEQFPERLAVVRLGPGAEVPAWAESSSLFSITATARETSVVCAARSVPKKARQQGPFAAFAVEGPLDLTLTGVLAELLIPLAEAEISVFTISTFDTDWILVPYDAADRAAEEWRRRGHTVAPAVPVNPQENPQ